MAASQEDSKTRNYSSEQEPLPLIARGLDRTRAADFLVELANWPGPGDWSQTAEDARVRALERFPEYSPETSIGKLGEEERTRSPLSGLAVSLRYAWSQVSVREREECLFAVLSLASGNHHHCVNPAEAEKWGRVTAALFLGVRLTPRMRICANADCRRQRFFLAERKNQRYCTAECAGAGYREIKKSWWSEHGPAWRQARKRKMKRAKRAKTAKRKRS